MSVFKKVPSSHHKLILRGKDTPTYNIDKCSAEGVYFPLAIILLSKRFKSGFYNFQVWHLLELTKYFSNRENWCEVTWRNMTFCPMELKYFYINFVSIVQFHFWQIIKPD